MINGNDEDDGLNWYKVTYEDFLRYIYEKPEWLYRKLQLIHEWFKDVMDDCEAWLVESELNGQTKDGEIVLIKKWLEEIIKCLNQMTLD